MSQSQEYVTNGKLNSVIFEIKNEIKDLKTENEKQHLQHKHDTELLQNTLASLNKTISDNTTVVSKVSEELKKNQEDIAIMKYENTARDFLIKDLEDFRDETTDKLSGRFVETAKLLGIIVGVFGTIIVAIIQIAPALFG